MNLDTNEKNAMLAKALLAQETLTFLMQEIVSGRPNSDTILSRAQGVIDVMNRLILQVETLPA